MQNKKNYPVIFLIILFAALNLFIGSNKIYSQENNPQNSSQDNDDVILDSIDVKENLLDSNTVYQRDFDSLSNEGEWVKINRSDLIQDVSGDSETIVEDEDPTAVKIIYIWRPRNIDSEWSPYSNGRWVFTYRGWIWESDYSWGWACYNYGRWYWSSYYGWCWLPGRVWAPNWCHWRTYNNYCGWYPTCPRIHWRHHGRWVRNLTFKSKTKNWTFVDKKDFTKKIDKTVIVKPEKNSDILKNSEKIKSVNTFVSDKKQIKYNGPDVSSISKQTGEQITPQKVKITKVNDAGVKNPNNGTTKNGTTKTNTTRGDGNYNPPKGNTTEPTTKAPRTNNEPTTKAPRTNTGPTTKSDPPKGNGPTKSNPPSNGPTKSNPPKNNGPVKSDPPKNNGPKNDGGKKK